MVRTSNRHCLSKPRQPFLADQKPSLLIVISLLVFLTASQANAQTTTIVDSNGNTVVAVVGTAANGSPATQILSTIATATAPPTTAEVPVHQGPDLVPPRTTDTGTDPISYSFTFTTVDGEGRTTRIVQPFSPVYETVTPPFHPTISGSVWSWDDYASSYGTSIATGHSSALRSTNLTITLASAGFAWLSIILGMVLGGYVVARH